MSFFVAVIIASEFVIVLFDVFFNFFNIILMCFYFSQVNVDGFLFLVCTFLVYIMKYFCENHSNFKHKSSSFMQRSLLLVLFRSVCYEWNVWECYAVKQAYFET